MSFIYYYSPPPNPGWKRNRDGRVAPYRFVSWDHHSSFWLQTPVLQLGHIRMVSRERINPLGCSLAWVPSAPRTPRVLLCARAANRGRRFAWGGWELSTVLIPGALEEEEEEEGREGGRSFKSHLWNLSWSGAERMRRRSPSRAQKHDEEAELLYKKNQTGWCPTKKHHFTSETTRNLPFLYPHPC